MYEVLSASTRRFTRKA